MERYAALAAPSWVVRCGLLENSCQPAFNFDPDAGLAQGLVVAGVLHENQPLGSRQRGEHTPGMFWSRIDVLRAVNQEDGRVDSLGQGLEKMSVSAVPACVAQASQRSFTTLNVTLLILLKGKRPTCGKP